MAWALLLACEFRPHFSSYKDGQCWWWPITPGEPAALSFSGLKLGATLCSVFCSTWYNLLLTPASCLFNCTVTFYCNLCRLGAKVQCEQSLAAMVLIFFHCLCPKINNWKSWYSPRTSIAAPVKYEAKDWKMTLAPNWGNLVCVIDTGNILDTWGWLVPSLSVWFATQVTVWVGLYKIVVPIPCLT